MLNDNYCHNRRQLSQLCDRGMFGDLFFTCQTPGYRVTSTDIIQIKKVHSLYEVKMKTLNEKDVSEKKTLDKHGIDLLECEKRRASVLIDQLLIDIYAGSGNHTDYNSTTSFKSQLSSRFHETDLNSKGLNELVSLAEFLEDHVIWTGSSLVRQLKRRDALRRQRDAHCDVINCHLRKWAPEKSEMRFTIQPAPGESGFSQWVAAMKMVSQLPGGIPLEFRRRLWLTLADKHLASTGVDWTKVERNCFSEWSHPADAELGVQIVKDLHRTGCSLFCGVDGQENQALLKRVLLAYARWNKAVGYCQGFNMLAALILQVTEKCESDALKLMIYLIEGVLPESYFADSLRGLSVDMAVFRELLRSRVPHLSRHLDALQEAAKDGTTSYEPPLTNVFTMQWFLTLFCNCLPQPTVLRVWDLILLEGNEMLLRTALAIWQALSERILTVRSADEFYSIMGVLTREMLEFGLVDANSLIKAVVAIGTLPELKSLREHYMFNINPLGSSLSSFMRSRNDEGQLNLYPKERLVLDISALKKQYIKLKQRQRQAHIIFNAAVTRQATRTAPVAMNHLLLGKSALVSAKRLGPPKGAVPPARQTPTTLFWKDTPKTSSSSSSSDTELCDEPGDISSDEGEAKSSQFDDNLKMHTSDKVDLMTEDNTTNCEEISARDVAITSANVNLFPTDTQQEVNLVLDQNVQRLNEITSVDNKIVIDPVDAEFNDDSFDFEKFLEERMRCLKNIDTTEVEKSECTEETSMKLGRRNSQRAMEIMQENSLILHRILQCQSRLTPSPPLAIEEKSSLNTPNSEQTNFCNITFEKKRDNSLINCATTSPTPSISGLNHNSALPRPNSVTDLNIANTHSPNLDICSINTNSPMVEEGKSKYSSILEYSKNLNEKYNTLILNSTFSNIIDRTASKDTLSFTSPIGDEAEVKQGSSEEVMVEVTDSPTSKTPGQVYNPFPVKVSSRQNKDVAIRLGLYKK